MNLEHWKSCPSCKIWSFYWSIQKFSWDLSIFLPAIVESEKISWKFLFRDVIKKSSLRPQEFIRNRIWKSFSWRSSQFNATKKFKLLIWRVCVWVSYHSKHKKGKTLEQRLFFCAVEKWRFMHDKRETFRFRQSKNDEKS